MLAQVGLPGRQKQGNQEFKVIHSYTVSWRPDWAAEDSVSEVFEKI